jgi:hypothetical protein
MSCESSLWSRNCWPQSNQLGRSESEGSREAVREQSSPASYTQQAPLHPGWMPMAERSTGLALKSRLRSWRVE